MIGNARERFGVKFYVVALLFIVFDVEAVFLYPWAVLFRELGWNGFMTMGIFVSTLVAGAGLRLEEGRPRLGDIESNADTEVVPALTTRRDEAEGFLRKSISKGLGWARKNSLFTYPFVTACCGMEYMSVASAATTSPASAPSSRASRRARPTC